jgi:glutaredoxin
VIVDLFSKEDCHLCEEAKGVLEKVRQEIPFTLRETKITPGDHYYEQYKEMVPVVHVNNQFAFKYRISESALRVRLTQIAGSRKYSDGHSAEDEKADPG